MIHVIRGGCVRTERHEPLPAMRITNLGGGGGGKERRTKREESRARKEQTTGTPFSFVRRGEIETANRVGVDEGEGREEAGA